MLGTPPSWRRVDGVAGTWPLRALAPAARTAKTSKIPRIAPAWRFAQGIGTCFAQANGLARKPALPPSWGSWVSCWSWPAHQKMKSLRAARPPPAAPPQTLISGLFSDGGWGIIQTLWPRKGRGKTDYPRSLAVFHHDELMENWALAAQQKELFPIEPLR